tara:strand:+ start:313 stop:636 length:324 start_codon:yes stop_codon:yes gene_type:complete
MKDYTVLILLAVSGSGIKRAFVIENLKSAMSKVCQVTGKKPLAGNNVSHAKNRSKRTFQPNLHKHKFWVESENRYVSLTVSANGMRTIDKNGIDKVLADIRARGEKI